MTLSKNTLKLLELMASTTLRLDCIDAKEYSEEIVELLKAGFVKLGGTLQAATLELTDAGRLHGMSAR